MKEDVLEQIVDDYLQFDGYFTIHNLRFRPHKSHAEYRAADDSVASDVDVVGYNPRKRGRARVVVVSCKAWQSGFDATAHLAELRGEKQSPRNKKPWRHFRELWIPKWSEAFREAILDRTGQRDFTYRIAVTRLKGDADASDRDPTIKTNLSGCSIGFLPLAQMWPRMLAELTTTPPREMANRSRTETVASASMLRAHFIASASRGELIDDVQQLQDVPVSGLVELEVKRPHVSGRSACSRLAGTVECPSRWRLRRRCGTHRPPRARRAAPACG